MPSFYDLAPCGTYAAVRRHRRRGEPLDEACTGACTGSPGGPPATQPCGTAAAARRHYRRREPLDEACLQAARSERAWRNGQDAGAQSPDLRERRNGIPWRPYVYRGLGYDQLTGEMDLAC